MKTATADVTTEFHPTRVDLPKEPLDEKGRQELIRNLESEQGFAHRELPLGAGMQLVANGTLSPRDEEYKKILYEKGQSAAAGDRVQVTALQFRPDRIVIDLNGGPYAKHRFLSHISLNDIPLAQEGPAVTGCRITLVFEGGIPEVTAAEVKALLDPVVDFRAKSSGEAYADTLPPKVREAVEAHEILVGMNRRMVIAAMGEPKTKEREHSSETDPDSPIYEEWIYGDPPQPTQFVRFKNGRVARLEIAAIGKPIEVHDKNEMGSRSRANTSGPDDRERRRAAHRGRGRHQSRYCTHAAAARRGAGYAGRCAGHGQGEDPHPDGSAAAGTARRTSGSSRQLQTQPASTPTVQRRTIASSRTSLMKRL